MYKGSRVLMVVEIKKQTKSNLIDFYHWLGFTLDL